MADIRIKLTKSLIGAKPKQKLTASSMGLSKIGDSLVCEDSAALRGKINVVAHLVKVEEQN